MPLNATKGISYTFYMKLIDSSSRPDFKSNPTIAAGDFKISKDGGAEVNLTTLPDAEPNGSTNIRIQLSATEMDANQIIINAIDAADNEWDDNAEYIDTIPIPVNLKEIQQNSTTSNLATLTLKQFDIQNTNGPAMIIKTSSTTSTHHALDIEQSGDTGGSGIKTKSANQAGLHATGENHGMLLDGLAGGGSGIGLEIIAGTGVSGMKIVGDPESAKHGMEISGGRDGDGINITGGLNGINCSSVIAGGNGALFTGEGSGAGLKIQGGNTGHGIDIDAGASGGNGVDIFSLSAVGYKIVTGGNTGFYISASGTAMKLESIGGDSHGLELIGNSQGHGLKSTGGGIQGHGAFFDSANGGDGIRIFGNNGGHGLNIAGGSSSGFDGGHGIVVIGGDSTLTNGNGGHGINIAGGAPDGSGTGGDGIRSIGNDAGAGFSIVGGLTGHGISILGGGTSGDGIFIDTTSGNGITSLGRTNGSGIQLLGSGTGQGIGMVSGAGGGIKIVTTGHGIDIDSSGTDKHGINVLVTGNDGHGINLSTAGTGNGIDINTVVGDGINIAVATLGNGISITAIGTSKHGIVSTGGLNGAGMHLQGIGSGAGLSGAGGAEGPGIKGTSPTAGSGMELIGSGGNHGLISTGGTSGHGAKFVKGPGGKDIDADETDIVSLGISYDFVTYPSDGPVILFWNGKQGVGNPLWWATVYTESGGTPSNSAEIVRVDKLRDFATDTPT